MVVVWYVWLRQSDGIVESIADDSVASRTSYPCYCPRTDGDGNLADCHRGCGGHCEPHENANIATVSVWLLRQLPVTMRFVVDRG